MPTRWLRVLISKFNTAVRTLIYSHWSSFAVSLITGNAGRLGNRVIDWVQSFLKGQEGVSEMAGNAAGKRVGEQIGITSKEAERRQTAIS